LGYLYIPPGGSRFDTDTWRCHDLDTAAGPFVKEEQLTMRACRYCGESLMGKAPCPHCGAWFGPTVCQQCGRRWPLGQRRCWNGVIGCGAKIEQGCVGKCRIEKTTPIPFKLIERIGRSAEDFEVAIDKKMAQAARETLDKMVMEML